MPELASGHRLPPSTFWVILLLFCQNVSKMFIDKARINMIWNVTPKTSTSCLRSPVTFFQKIFVLLQCIWDTEATHRPLYFDSCLQKSGSIKRSGQGLHFSGSCIFVSNWLKLFNLIYFCTPKKQSWNVYSWKSVNRNPKPFVSQESNCMVSHLTAWGGPARSTKVWRKKGEKNAHWAVKKGQNKSWGAWAIL